MITFESSMSPEEQERFCEQGMILALPGPIPAPAKRRRKQELELEPEQAPPEQQD